MSKSKICNFQDKCTSFSDMIRLWPLTIQAGKTCKVKSHHVKGTEVHLKFEIKNGQKSGKHILVNQTGFLVTINIRIKGSQEVM